MKSAIVITSIFAPTEAVRLYSRRSEQTLIVVGDRKSPADWSSEGACYLPLGSPQTAEFRLSASLPVDHYCRKMLGYLVAMQQGAQAIVDTDDDNLPHDRWGFPGFDGVFEGVRSDLGFVNVYQLFTRQKIWPRGLPLDLIHTDFGLDRALFETGFRVGVWQGLADEDPDVDAIYRLTCNEPCTFERRAPVVLDTGTVSPFNSQNTLFRKELFALLYLPTAVSFRFTDILRGLVAQPIMWRHGFHLGFTDATVRQLRNPHDFMADFRSEQPMYQHCDDIVERVDAALRSGASMEDHLYEAYRALISAGIVPVEEMKPLLDWLYDLQRLRHSEVAVHRATERRLSGVPARLDEPLEAKA
jgi:hypothetical protein